MSATRALVIEVGCEEIPARFLGGAERRLGEALSGALRAARLLPDETSVRTASTPRRLIAYVPALSVRQPDRVERVTGPPVKAAFDAHGNPTRAADSFAAKNGAKASELMRVTTAKGEYVALDVPEAGKPASQVLVEILPSVIGGISFPKSMYWTAKSGPLFARPIRWILALLGNEGDACVVPFEFAGVSSGNATYGHRLDGSGPIAVSDLNLDLLLEKHLVVVCGADRLKRVRSEINVLLENSGFRVASDKFLEDWVVNSTEWPVALMGEFNKRYLALPREVLVTVMRDHQKYFAVEDGDGNLQPRFITVLNVPGDPKGLIRQGHERVLEARFSDAKFFWESDQKITLAARVPMLERVTYQEKVGTYADKVRRMRTLAENICEELEKAGSLAAAERRDALRAVELSKCDLTTQMVQEFTELQGVIGGLYARAQGEPAGVADAIYDHYRPAGLEDSCPRTRAGAIVSLADKFDSVVAGFAAGLQPTGSSDPFALRRAGNGIVKLAAEALPGLDLTALANGTISGFNTVYAALLDSSQGAATALARRVEDFLRERLEFYLREAADLRYDTVRAVLGSAYLVQNLVPSEALNRAKALERVRDTEDFIALAAAAKRTRNIRKSAGSADLVGGALDERLFAEPAERDLVTTYRDASEEIRRLSATGDYGKAFHVMAAIRPQVDRFFDQVLVMAKDEPVRRNRLALLDQLNTDLFTSLADLAEIASEERTKPAD